MDGTVILMDYSSYERQKARHILGKTGSFSIIEVVDFNRFKLLDFGIPDLKLVIADIAFPTEADGFMALERIRSAGAQIVPIIIVTQINKPETRAEALKYSVNDYILKPYQAKRLENSIRSLVRTKKAFFYDTGGIRDISMPFDSFVEREIKYSGRTGTPLSLILITTLFMNPEPENSQYIQDEHKASVFAVAAQKAKEALRTTDLIVQNRDRDILIVLPCTGREGARLVCEKIKALMDPEFEKLNMDRNKCIYPVYVTFPDDGDGFQPLMQAAFKKISEKEMLEKIVSIPDGAKKYAEKTYNRYKKWF